jgi:hypothetical protein
VFREFKVYQEFPVQLVQ